MAGTGNNGLHVIAGPSPASVGQLYWSEQPAYADSDYPPSGPAWRPLPHAAVYNHNGIAQRFANFRLAGQSTTVVKLPNDLRLQDRGPAERLFVAERVSTGWDGDNTSYYSQGSEGEDPWDALRYALVATEAEISPFFEAYLTDDLIAWCPLPTLLHRPG